MCLFRKGVVEDWDMSVLHMSVTAGVLILGILLFRSFFLHKISKKIIVILWEIAILRLLFPVSVAVPLPDLGKYQNHRLQAWIGFGFPLYPGWTDIERRTSYG